MKILVSACLCGIDCRYDGKSNRFNKIDDIFEKYEIIPFCPECYGGLATPRPPAEIVSNSVITCYGDDVTSQYIRGAEQALELCKRFNIKYALLKERSPSCGKNYIYDGSFSKKLVSGHGICAGMLINNGINVFGESEIDVLLKCIDKENPL